MGALGVKTTVTTTQEIRYDADGTSWMQIVAHGDLTALTPYMVFPGQTGYVTAAISGAMYGYIGVPAAAVDSGDTAWVQIGGRVDDMVTASLAVTAGHAMSMTTEAVADENNAWTGAIGAGEFAVCTTTTGSAQATQDCFLVGEKILTIA